MGLVSRVVAAKIALTLGTVHADAETLTHSVSIAEKEHLSGGKRDDLATVRGGDKAVISHREAPQLLNRSYRHERR